MTVATKESKKYNYGTGRRKRSVARVRVYKDGKGEFIVNDKPLKEYFTTETMIEMAQQAITSVGKMKDFNVHVKISGGGLQSQAEAIRLGTARALVNDDETLRTSLKPKGYLKRDPRKKERKKPGLKKARRAPQFSKR